MLCRDVMTTDVFTCHAGDGVAECARTMRDRNIGFLPVLDHHRRVVGVVTDRDLVLRALAEGREPDTPVSAVMTRDVVSCWPLDDLETAEACMAGGRKSRLVVVDEQGRCAGVISLSDIAQTEARARVGRILSAVTKREVRAPAGSDV
jgi:CBS domain-containing protein